MMNLIEGAHEWMRTLRGFVAAAGVALLALGAVFVAWPRPGGFWALGAGAVLLGLAWGAGIPRDAKKKLHLAP